MSKISGNLSYQSILNSPTNNPIYQEKLRCLNKKHIQDLTVKCDSPINGILT